MDHIPTGALFGALTILLILSAFFSGSETALMTLNRYRLRHQAEDGHPGARLAENLERPENWDEVLMRIPDPDVRLDFNRELEEGVASREADRRRKQLVEDRARAVYGIPDEEYSRVGALGTEIKINGKCYVLVENAAVESGSRWYRTNCKEIRTNPLLLDPIEYDALGRVVAD